VGPVVLAHPGSAGSLRLDCAAHACYNRIDSPERREFAASDPWPTAWGGTRWRIRLIRFGERSSPVWFWPWSCISLSTAFLP